MKEWKTDVTVTTWNKQNRWVFWWNNHFTGWQKNSQNELLMKFIQLTDCTK